MAESLASPDQSVLFKGWMGFRWQTDTGCHETSVELDQCELPGDIAERLDELSRARQVENKMKRLVRDLYEKVRSFRGSSVDKMAFNVTYPRLVRSLKRAHDKNRAMQLAVGGEFGAVGILELELVKFLGLRQDAYLIDVGCGSGRLAKPLSQFLMGRYLGIDVVPELVRHARDLVARPEWRFEVAAGLRIPEGDDAADMVCFFSLFTHLLHEQSYAYLQEAKRVLKPRGKIVFSFLDFDVIDHWSVFESNIKDLAINTHPLNMFISKDAIPTWAQHLGLEVESIERGDNPFLPLSKPVIFENGSMVEKHASFGQSVCVLQKPATTELSKTR